MITDVKLITSLVESRDMIIDGINWATTIDFAVAWASIGSDPERELSTFSKKIRYGVVGIEFNQTDPKFIKKYQDKNTADNRGIRFFIGRSENGGLFHPKIYSFYNRDEKQGRIFVGSHNFTTAAFHKNIEASLYFDWSGEINDDNAVEEILKEIKRWWTQSRLFTDNELEVYGKAYDEQIKNKLNIDKNVDLNPQKVINPEMTENDNTLVKENEISHMATAGKINHSKVIRSDFDITWNEYIERILSIGKNRRDSMRIIESRLEMLSAVRNIFIKNNYIFANCDENERRKIAGYENHKDGEPEFLWFGSMKGAGWFKKFVKRNDVNFSAALDHIPSSGIVTQLDYQKFINKFLIPFRNDGDGLPMATRLLAMKRPDIFFCINGPNYHQIVKSMGLSLKGKKDYSGYWSKIIDPIHKSKWFNTNCPSDSLQRKIWRSRVAMLDAFLFDPVQK